MIAPKRPGSFLVAATHDTPGGRTHSGRAGTIAGVLPLVLVVEADPTQRERICAELAPRHDTLVVPSSSGLAEALDRLSGSPRAVLASMAMNGEPLAGLSLLRQVLVRAAGCRRILLASPFVASCHRRRQEALRAEARPSGSYELALLVHQVVAVPWSPGDLLSAVARPAL